MPARLRPAYRARVLIGALAMALLPAAALAAPASATSGHGPRYSLSILEGATTLPEYEQASSTSGSVSPSAQVAVSIIRGGTTLYRDVQSGGGAWLSQVPAVGDEVTLESPVGTVVARTVYDGLPTMDATVCAGSTNFSGQNSLGNIVEGKYFNKVLVHPYHHGIEVHQTAYGEAQVKTLSGTSFGGSFLTPLVLGEDVEAIESLKTPLAGEATYTYTSEVERPVGACPAPPPVFNPPPAPALQGTIAKLLRTTIHGLPEVRGTRPGHDQPARDGHPGPLPGRRQAPRFSAGSKTHKSLPPSLLLAHGSAAASAAGKVTVHLKLTRTGSRQAQVGQEREGGPDDHPPQPLRSQDKSGAPHDLAARLAPRSSGRRSA
jgi:hypothetical protein